MDAGRWFFPVVRGHCRDRSCGRFRAAAGRAARSGSRRIRRLSFLLQDPRPVLPGRPARLRQFGHYHRLLCRARFRFVLWRHSDGQVWLAVVFPRAWSPQLGVASTCGRLSDRWIVAGATPTLVRKGFTSVAMAGAAIFVVPCVLVGPRLATVFVVLVAASLGMCSSNVWAITQTLAGPRAAGRWTGIQNFVGNLGGAAAPALTGFVLGRTGHYLWAFAITAAMSLLGALSWAFWIGRVEPVDWKSRVRANPVSEGSFQ